MSEPEIFTFDPTVLNEFQMCFRKGEFTHVKNLRGLQGKPMPMDRGSMLHDMLAMYRILLKLSWRAGDPDALTESELQYLKEYEVLPSVYTWRDMVEVSTLVGRTYMAGANLSSEDGETTINNFVEYCDYYQADGWQPIEVEAVFSKHLYESDELILIMEGKIDLLTDSRAGRTIVDSKSADRRKDPEFLSNQFIAYAWALDAPSVIVDKIGFQKTLKAKDRFQRHTLSYPRAIKEEWKEWAIWWGLQIVYAIKNGIYPPNFTSCDKYGGCIYKPICSTTPDAREWKAATLFRAGEPWSPHGKEYVSTVGETDGS
jgi:hypothetical protein